MDLDPITRSHKLWILFNTLYKQTDKKNCTNPAVAKEQVHNHTTQGSALSIKLVTTITACKQILITHFMQSAKIGFSTYGVPI